VSACLVVAPAPAFLHADFSSNASKDQDRYIRLYAMYNDMILKLSTSDRRIYTRLHTGCIQDCSTEKLCSEDF
jgi:hypothetical protein